MFNTVLIADVLQNFSVCRYRGNIETLIHIIAIHHFIAILSYHKDLFGFSISFDWALFQRDLESVEHILLLRRAKL